jgi:hypothetical protein
MKNGINENTTVSVGVATAIVALALSAGVGFEHARSRIMSAEEKLSHQATWNASVDNVLVELKDVTKRHTWRIERLERDDTQDKTVTSDTPLPAAS